MKTLTKITGLCVLLGPTWAQADVLDFYEVGGTTQNATSVDLSNATITTEGGDIWVDHFTGIFLASAGGNGGFCGTTEWLSVDCSVDSTITFDSLISNLTFEAARYDTGDSAQASIFSGETLLATISYTSNMLVDFTGYSGITSLYLDDLGSTELGFVYGNFSFDSTAVPEPATLALFGLGLAGIGFSRRKKA